MQFEAIHQAIFDWVKSAVSETPGVTIYWDEPDAPRPPMPAVRISFLTGPTMVGQDSLSPVANNPNQFKITGRRTMLLSVNAYGDEAMQLLSDLQTSISNPLDMEILSAVRVSVLNTSAPRDINTALETKIESRGQMDITLLATEEKIVGLSYIESTEVLGHVSGNDLTVTAGNGGE